ncbi:MAG: adenosylmethionine--8-amino-7-oxononanoate transaminase [Planctomycetota bacterium]|nr:adenosylmethionine--8-amino-7-oxononanoate transaminase [Planctomycetota bacterium]
MSELISRDAAHLWHPYTQHGLEAAPLPIARAKDAVLTLADGRELIDAISSWWATLHGHGNPVLIEAMERQARELDHAIFAGATHEPAVALAEAVLDVAPAGLARVFYSDDGSTAVEVALKMAYQRWVHAGEPQRTVFVALEGGYHGDTFGAMAVGEPAPFFETFEPLLFEVRRVTPDEESLHRALEELGERACAVILEPLVQGAAGMVMHEPGFLRAARGLCDQSGLPLIVDEVMTGFGRTGSLFACEKAGVTPDLMCLAKGLTGGMLPLAATLATEEIYAAFLSTDRSKAFFHGHTFTAHPIGCAVGLASLGLVRANDVPARLDAIGRRIEEGLRDVADGERVRDLRRTGGIVALELAPPKGDRTGYLANLSLRLRAEAIERGVLLRPLGNVLYAMPPACTTDEQCDTIGQVMGELVRLI